MKDLDFDELDRAVNTLMNDVSKTDISKDTDDQTNTLSITPTLPEAAPAPVTPVSPTTANDVHVRTSTPSSPPLAARRGRFMDVVHSSSDMKKDKAPSQPISRQGVTLTPSKTVMPEPSPAPVIPAPEPTPAAPSEPIEKPGDSDTHASDWPDPLELSGFKPDSNEKLTTQSMPEPTPLLEEGSETPAVAPTSDDIQPLSTPFLTDAKVEKRPLGSPTVSAPEEKEEAPEPDHTPVVSTSDTSLTVDDPSDQLVPSIPDEPKKELPPELQGDLVAIESGSSTENNVKSVETTAEKPVETPQPSSHPTALLEAKTDDEPVFTGPTSIAQQYKEEPNTGDQKNGAIYDTDAYHKPLAHPAKKKSGWLWVVWILLILLVGAGAGAALYFSGIF